MSNITNKNNNQDNNGYFKGYTEASVEIIFDILNEVKDDVKDLKKCLTSQISTVNRKVESLNNYKNKIIGACALIAFIIPFLFEILKDKFIK